MKQGQLIKARPRYSEAFERFWRAYPDRKPNPKAPAAATFQELERAGEDAEGIIQAAGRFAAECRKLDTKSDFIPHARTWLAQRRFEDYLGADADVGEEGARQADDVSADPLFRAVSGDITPVEYGRWIKPLEIEIENGVAIVTAPSRFHADWVRNHYGDRLRRALGRRIEIRERRSR